MITDFIEKLGNRLIRLDPETLARLGKLQGKVIRLEIAELPRPLYLLPSNDGLRVADDHEGAADITLRGQLPAFLRLASGSDNTALFEGEVEVQGEVELGQKLQRMLRDFSIDWEEILSHYTGDVIAHRLARSARQAHAWHRDARQALERDMAEYLQEEIRLLPVRGEVDRFLGAVDVLRADLDRLEQRVARLRGRTGAGE